MMKLYKYIIVGLASIIIIGLVLYLILHKNKQGQTKPVVPGICDPGYKLYGGKCTKIQDESTCEAQLQVLDSSGTKCIDASSEEKQIICEKQDKNFSSKSNTCEDPKTKEDCAKEIVDTFYRLPDPSTNNTTCRDPTDIEKGQQCVDKGDLWDNANCHPTLKEVVLTLVNTTDIDATFNAIIQIQDNIQKKSLSAKVIDNGASKVLWDNKTVTINVPSPSCVEVVGQECDEFSVDGLSANTDYTIQITYTTSIGSKLSNVVSFKTGHPIDHRVTESPPIWVKPDHISNDLNEGDQNALFAVTACIDTSCSADTMNITIQWQPSPTMSSRPISYSLRRQDSRSSASWTTLVTSGTNSVFTDTQQSAGSTYNYQVKAETPQSISDWSSSLQVNIPTYTNDLCARIVDSTTPMGHKIIALAGGKCITPTVSDLQGYCLSTNNATLVFYDQGRNVCSSLDTAEYNLGNFSSCTSDCGIGSQTRQTTCHNPSLNGKEMAYSDFNNWLTKFKPNLDVTTEWKKYHNCPPEDDSSWNRIDNTYGYWVDQGNNTFKMDKSCTSLLGKNSSCCNGFGDLELDSNLSPKCTCQPNFFGPTCSLTEKQFTCADAGTLSPDGKSCVCQAGFNGTFCQFSRVTTCRDRGNPTSTGGCTCDADWMGDYCECPNTALACAGRDEAKCTDCNSETGATHNSCAWASSQTTSNCNPVNTPVCMSCLPSGTVNSILVPGDYRSSAAAIDIMNNRCCSKKSTSSAKGKCGASHQWFDCTCG